MPKRRRKKKETHKPSYTSVADAKLVRRCVRGDWNPPPDTRDRLIDEMMAMLESGTVYQGLAAAQTVIAMVEADRR